ncbi:MAG: hypothetical protein P1U86_19300 [Verrucomicrobiales bacterium]|nr:hypothetical protein [Verrucomicrobiales bacterium]
MKDPTLLRGDFYSPYGADSEDEKQVIQGLRNQVIPDHATGTELLNRTWSPGRKPPERLTQSKIG